jgi:hypothetical protein
MTSSHDEIEAAILQAINDSRELFTLLEGVPDEIGKTVASFVPVDTGTAKASIEVKARRTALKRLTKRRAKLGEVYSDDDHAKIATLEYGRDATDDNGPTPEFAMFRRAVMAWEGLEL